MALTPAGSTANQVDSLNGHFKELYADKIKDLIPDGVKLYNMIDFMESKKLGNAYNQPVTLGLEHGFTYGGSDGAAFDLLKAIASTHENASIKGHEMVLRSYLSVGAVSRSMTSQAAFVQESKLIVQNMLKSFARRLEVQLMYGKVGLGVIASNDTTSCVIYDHEWAAGIWAGAEKMEVEIVDAADVDSSSISGAAAISAKVSSVDFASKTITFDSAVFAGVDSDVDRVILYSGARSKEFAGIHKIMSNKTDPLFGINAANYSLFRSNEVEVGSDATSNAAVLSFDKLEEAVAVAMEKGLVDEDVLVICNPKSWKNLLTEQAGKRMYDSSHSTEKAVNGSKNIEFYGQNGKIEITSSIFCKEGYAYVLPIKEFMRIGSSDITFDQPGFEGKFLKLLEHANAYELRAYTDQALFCPAPGLSTLMKFIKS
jgi:hypothetical protein